MNRRGWMALASVCAVLLSGCGLGASPQIELTSPVRDTAVRLPLDVRWQMRGDTTRVAVFFDRSPLAPGDDLLSLVPERDPCRSNAPCPDALWLRQHNVYVVEGSSVRVDDLPDRRTRHGAPDDHRVVVVRLDSQGRRVNETAASLDFVLERDAR